MDSSLRKRCRDSLAARLASLPGQREEKSTQAMVVLDRELTAIAQQGLEDILSRLCDYSSVLAERQIPVQTVGAASGSIVLFALELNHVFPPDHGLHWERYFDGSALASGVLHLDLDVPTGLDVAEFMDWTQHTLTTKPDAIRLSVTCAAQRYLSLYQSLREQLPGDIPPPASWEAYSTRISPANIIRNANTLGVPDFRGQDWTGFFAPHTWTDLLVLAGRRRSRPVDCNVVREYAWRRGVVDFAWNEADREAAAGFLARELLVFQEDLMSLLNGMIGLRLDSASRLIRAVAKHDRLLLNREYEIFTAAAQEQQVSENAAEQLFDFAIATVPRTFCKAHACSRSLWAGYVAYLASVVSGGVKVA